MLSYNELRKGILFVLEGEPYLVMEYAFLRMQQRKPVTKTKIKNLISGKIVERNFHQNENFEEAEIIKSPIKFLYASRGEFWFADPKNLAKRFSFNEDFLGEQSKFLKSNSEVTAVIWNERTIAIELPVKMDFKVTETPPGEKGNTAAGGGKVATLETGAVVTVPLFVNTGDIIKVNTQTGEYDERVEKGKEL